MHTDCYVIEGSFVTAKGHFVIRISTDITLDRAKGYAFEESGGMIALLQGNRVAYRSRGVNRYVVGYFTNL